METVIKLSSSQSFKKKPCRVVVAVGGVLQLSEAAFQRACHSSWKVKLSCSFFPEFSQFASFFKKKKKQQPLWLCRRIPTQRLSTWNHTSISVTSYSFLISEAPWNVKKLGTCTDICWLLFLGEGVDPPIPSATRASKWDCYQRNCCSTHPLTS